MLDDFLTLVNCVCPACQKEFSVWAEFVLKDTKYVVCECPHCKKCVDAPFLGLSL